MMARQMAQIISGSFLLVLILLAVTGLFPHVGTASAANASVEPARPTEAFILPTPQPTRAYSPSIGLALAHPQSVVVRTETKKWVTFGERQVRSDVVDVRLTLFPRPPEDNGRGLHWFPTMAQTPAVVDRFVPELEQMKVHWLVILQGLDDWNWNSNDYLITRVREAGILPVMRIQAQVGGLDLERLQRVVAHDRALGVQYFQIFNEPNAREEWTGVAYPTADPFIQNWIPAAEVVARNGGLPGLAPLMPSGDHADELFLDAELRSLVRAGRYDLINVMWLAIHNYGAMDANGFLRYRRYAAIARAALGQNIPMLATEGGAGDAFTSGDTVVSAFRAMQTREPWFLAYCPWLIGNAIGGGQDELWESAAWFQRGGPLPIVGRVKDLP